MRCTVLCQQTHTKKNTTHCTIYTVEARCTTKTKHTRITCRRSSTQVLEHVAGPRYERLSGNYPKRRVEMGISSETSTEELSMESPVLDVSEEERSHGTSSPKTSGEKSYRGSDKTRFPGFYSVLFLRPKPSGEMRPIIDLKILNRLIVNKSFRMESARSIQAALQPGQFAISIDLTDAYFHIPIHPSFRKYLRFAVLGKVYQFLALPFGLAIAPRIFTEVMKEVGRLLREHGIIVHMYLDDWLIRDDQQQYLIIWSPNILELCELLGLLVNYPKSELTPKQLIDYVGVLYDLAVGRAYPPQKRIEKIKNIITPVMKRAQTPASVWLSLLLDRIGCQHTLLVVLVLVLTLGSLLVDLEARRVLRCWGTE